MEDGEACKLHQALPLKLYINLAILTMQFKPAERQGKAGMRLCQSHLQSVMNFMSPMGFSSEYMPPCSSSWRTISLVTWSPQSLMAGIEMSSTKMVMILPPGGPKVRP